MSTQFFTKLIQNYIELLKDDEYYDITIEVGEDPNVKIFRAHMNILCYRSPYLRRILSSNKKNNDSVLAHIKLSNIFTENISKYFRIYLWRYSVSDLIEQHFGIIQQISCQSNNLLELQEFCTNLMVQSPEKIFKSFDFTKLSEKSLISLIKNDDLQMKEIEVWEHVLKWGLAQNLTLIPDPKTWSNDDFKTMKNILQHCLPLIRFFSLSSREFSQKVRPYQKLLDQQLYEDLLNSYLEPGGVSKYNVLRPRKIKNDEIKIVDSQIIDSKIVDFNIISTVSKWVDKVAINNDNYEELYLPYKFELLLRGSRDGFTPKKFHELCDGKANTVTFIKVKGNEEILGGYNPMKWETTGKWCYTNKSFIFSFKNKNIKDAILSNVIDAECALDYSRLCGPQFGQDLNIISNRNTNSFNAAYCRKAMYERNIRDTEDEFSIEDYEVFALIRTF
ncbi:unnamed protein product [Rhizophagus irregularis]|nr:unnamed protein product [Rhizophagus irregularis]